MKSQTNKLFHHDVGDSVVVLCHMITGMNVDKMQLRLPSQEFNPSLLGPDGSFVDGISLHMCYMHRTTLF